MPESKRKIINGREVIEIILNEVEKKQVKIFFDPEVDDEYPPVVVGDEKKEVVIEFVMKRCQSEFQFGNPERLFPLMRAINRREVINHLYFGDEIICEFYL